MKVNTTSTNYFFCKSKKMIFIIGLFLFSSIYQSSLAQEVEELKIENQSQEKEDVSKSSILELEDNVEQSTSETITQEETNKIDKKTPKKKQKKLEKNNKNQTIQQFSSKQLSGEKDSSDNSGVIYFILIVIGVFLILVVLIIIFYRYEKKCSNCKKWNAMKEYQRDLIGEKASKIKKTLKTKDRNGNVIKTTEVYVPATIYYYDIHRKCKYCGYKDTVKESEKKEN